eukprot:Protomagalhaensia_wolfi_Nauph_80__1382@NODE_1828_length_1319_cov_31_292969_g1428_i0_p3_GENE_NODE_1828_length_1319_cov_31_292969_g1428_i0NODE_1828_length_1319_cov_31_292969_g1428_i0_p3_ORF_typecomplete_len104_score5_18_NODE_1828_length_1319_cov_31_292969_g1428_i07031014
MERVTAARELARWGLRLKQRVQANGAISLHAVLETTMLVLHDFVQAGAAAVTVEHSALVPHPTNATRFAVKNIPHGVVPNITLTTVIMWRIITTQAASRHRLF